MTQGNPPTAPASRPVRAQVRQAIAAGRAAATAVTRRIERVHRPYRRGRLAFLVAAGYAAIVVLVTLAEIAAPHLPPEITGDLWNAPTAFVAWIVAMPISVPLIALAVWLPVPDWLTQAFFFLTPLASLLLAWLMWRLLRGRRIDGGA